MDVAAQSIRAVKSNYIGTIIYAFAQFGAQIFMMRELGPDAVGAFGYALLLFTSLALVLDQGFGWSLIRADFNDEREISTVFSRLQFACVVAALGVYGFSFYLGAALGDPLVGEVIAWSAPAYLLMGLFVVAQARLRKDLRFREIQIATTGSYLIAYPGVGVAMAAAGFGVWALLSAWYVQATLQIIVAYWYAPHPLRLSNPFAPTKSGPLGRRVASINLLGWASHNLSGVAAASLGPAALGVYNAALALASTPAQHLVQSLNSVLFSTASALDSDPQRVRRVYLGALATVAFVIVPAYAYGYTHSDLAISIILGEKWKASAPIMQILLAAMVVLPLNIVSSAILTATGREKAVLISELVCLCGLGVALLIALPHGLEAIGLAIAFAMWARFLLQACISVKCGCVGLAELARVFRGPLALAVLMAVPLVTTGSVMPVVAEQGLLLACKLLLAVALIRLFPTFFIDVALADVLGRFSIGNRLIGAMNLRRAESRC